MPDSSWTWYITEFDGQDICFGLVVGHEVELGYFSLAEITALRGPLGLRVERDLYFGPKSLEEVKYAHPEVDFNSRLDTLQAAVLGVKLTHLARWNEARRQAAGRYDRLLAGLPGLSLPATLLGNDHAWHLYVVRVARPDDVLVNLNAAGIGAAVHYSVPIHLQGAFAYLGHRRGDFPIAEAAAAEVLSLPLFPEITRVQQARVAAALAEALA